jgi:hypothetical protein
MAENRATDITEARDDVDNTWGKASFLSQYSKLGGLVDVSN